MRRRYGKAGAAAAIAVGLLIGAAPAAGGQPAGDPGHSGSAPYHGRIVSMMRHMTVEEKVGQLFVVEVYGRDANTVSPTAIANNQRLYGVDTPAQVIDKYKPGGVIYFTTRGPDNIGDPAQVATLSNGLQSAALGQRIGVPLLISVDQEGGALVARLGPPATQMPGNMALGAGRSTDDAHRSAEVIGTELAAVGINSDYAPVADVNVNPNNPVIGIRSVGSDPTLVADIVRAQVEGYHDGGIRATAKHFPGHGDTAEDSHFGLPEVTHTREQVEEIDLPPFRAAIDAGVDTIMTAHVVMRSIDPSGAPATMSQPILTGLLREELGFDGLIVTDALDMQGATSTYPHDVAPVQAFLAGADQLVLAPEMDVAYNAVLDAVRSGEISRERLDESVYRILLHKHRHGLFKDPFVDPAAAPGVLGAPEHVTDAQAITDRTTTLIKNGDGVLPLSAEPRDVLVTGWGVSTTQTIANQMAARGATASVVETGTTPSAAAIARSVAAAASADVVVVSTNNAYAINPETGLPTPAAAAQTALVRALIATGKPVVVSAMRNPYDVASFPEAPTVLATYGYTSHQLESLVRVLYGEFDPAGRLPVSIPNTDGSGDLFPFGHGLGF
jgi:beta-N-acetylhexosaminidase